MENIFNYKMLVHAIAGATGSVVAMSTTYPLDTLRFRMQLQDPDLIKKSTLEGLLYIIRHEGIGKLYMGMKPVLESVGISNFIYFYAFHGLKFAPFISRHIKQSNETIRVDFLISIFAGIINVLITSPLWVVNNRLKTKNNDHFKGLIDGIIHITRTEGFCALWASVLSDLIMVANPTIHFTMYHALKRKIPQKHHKALTFFLISALAKLVSTLTTYPIQVIQTNQRLGKEHSKRIKTYNDLFQGLEAKLLQTILTSALMYMTYEKIADFIFKILLREKFVKSYT